MLAARKGKIMVIKVKNCNECPFERYDSFNEYYYCEIGESDSLPSIRYVPSDCPLRKESITVQLDIEER